VPTYDHDRYAATLAWAVEWLRRSPAANPPQIAALRALLDMASATSATIRFYDGVLTVDDTVVVESHPVVGTLAGQLRAHSVLEISIARGAEAPELLALTRGLAASSGQGRLKERLRDAGSQRVMVILEQSHDVGGGRRRQVSFSQAFAKASVDEVVKDEWNKFLSSRAEHHEQGRQVDLGFAAASGAAATTEQAPTPEPPSVAEPAASAEPAAPPAAAALPTADVAPPAAAAPPPKPSLPQPATLQAASPLGVALANVLRDPFGSDILTRLTQLGRYVQEALREDRVAEAVDALNAMIDLEAKAPVGTARNSYAVVLKRTLPHEAVMQIIPYVLEPRRADRASVVLRRVGDEAAEILLGLLATAQTLSERMAYLRTVRAMPRGLNRVLSMLTRTEWQVVRNVAELIGEARVEEGVTYLARLAEHDDTRVRRTAIVALARVGSPTTVQPLRHLMEEGTPEIRALVAGSIGGADAKPLVALLVGVAEAESKPELVREYYKALGRIGAPEAVAALAKAAQPGGKLLGRKPAAFRVAAVEGLRLAGNEAALRALEALAQDGDKGVREAVRVALEGLRAKGGAAG
jgi:HEAT repeat protein